MSSVSNISPQQPHLYADSPWPCSEKIRIWSAMHPTTAKVITACSVIFMTGALALCSLSLGLPLGAAILISAIGFLLSMETVNHFLIVPPSASFTLMELINLPDDWDYYDRGYPNPKDFERVVKAIGPERFKEKLQREVLLETNPMQAYRIICRRLSEIKAGDDFFGPLPQLKQFFQARSQNLPCSQFVEREGRYNGTYLLQDKDCISYLLRSQMISNAEADLLNKAYEITDYYDRLEDSCRKIKGLAQRQGLVPERRYADQRIAQIREERRSAINPLDAEFAQLRLGKSVA